MVGVKSNDNRKGENNDNDKSRSLRDDKQKGQRQMQQQQQNTGILPHTTALRVRMTT
jgi:hypothetical protein